MKKTFTLIFTALLLHSVHAQTLETGIDLLRKEKFEQAKKELLAVQVNDKTNIAAFYLGNTYIRTGNTDSARIFFNIASTGNKTFSNLALARIALMDKKDSMTVNPYIEKAISESRKKDAEIFFQAGYLGYETSLVSDSRHIAYINRAIEMSPNAYYIMTLGDYYKDLKKLGNAMTEYENAHRADPNNVQVNLRVGSTMYSAAVP